MQSALVSTQRRLGEGLRPVAVGGAIQSPLARPTISETFYLENLFTMGGAVPPPGTDPASWPWPWDWKWWGPDKEDQSAEELPKGSEPGPVMPLPTPGMPVTNLVFLCGLGLMAFLILRRT